LKNDLLFEVGRALDLSQLLDKRKYTDCGNDADDADDDNDKAYFL